MSKKYFDEDDEEIEDDEDIFESDTTKIIKKNPKKDEQMYKPIDCDDQKYISYDIDKSIKPIINNNNDNAIFYDSDGYLLVDFQVTDIEIRDNFKIMDEDASKTCKVLITGVTLLGEGIFVVVKGFRPWIYVSKQDETLIEYSNFFDIQKKDSNATTLINENENIDSTSLKELEKHFGLEFSLKKDQYKRFYQEGQHLMNDLCSIKKYNPDWHPIMTIERRMFFYGWRPDPNTEGKTPNQYFFWKYSLPRSYMRRQFANNIRSKKSDIYNVWVDDIESKVQFMTEYKIKSNGWMRIKVDSDITCTDRYYTWGYRKEYVIDVSNIVIENINENPPRPTDKEIAPLEIASADIEVHCHTPGVFPKPEVPENCVTHIGVVSQKYTDAQDLSKSYSIMFCLFKTNTLRSANETRWYKTEAELLIAFRVYIMTERRTDCILWYNGRKFDWEFLYVRAKLLKVSEQFCRFSALRGDVTQEKPPKDGGTGSKQTGFYDTWQWKYTLGLFDMDVMIFIQKNYKLRSYSLNAVSALFLNDKKVDLHHTELPKLFKTEEGRREIGEYCVQDCKLPMRLMYNRQFLVQEIEMSRLSYTFLEDLQSRGQTYKITNKLFYELHYANYVMSYSLTKENLRSIQGATVLPPKTGFYQMVVTLDFMSLYPSIMIAHNLCPTTYIEPKNTLSDVKLKRYEKYITHTIGNSLAHTFNGAIVGVVPRIENELSIARKLVKKLMESDKENYDVFNARQLVLKLMMNSIYGYFTMAINRYACVSIGETVTYNGRLMIECTKRHVETYFLKERMFNLLKESLEKKLEDQSKFYLELEKKESQITLFEKEDSSQKQKLENEIIKLKEKPFYSPHQISYDQLYNYLLNDFKKDTNELETEVLYGDSVTCDTPILCRYQNKIFYKKINDIPKKTKWIKRGEKQMALPLDGFEVYSDLGFTSLKKIIRHQTNKKIFQVSTLNGFVHVTEDHSLLNEKSEMLHVSQLKIGSTQLLHQELPNIEECDNEESSKNNELAWILGLFYQYGFISNSCWLIQFPQNTDFKIFKVKNILQFYYPKVSFIIENNQHLILTNCNSYDSKMFLQLWSSWFNNTHEKKVPEWIMKSSKNIHLQFLNGCLAIQNEIIHNNQLAASNCYWLLKSFDFSFSISIQSNNNNIKFQLSEKVPADNTVQNIIEVGPTNDPVYDLETENHHFSAGVGSIVVHNTDSVMVHMPMPPTRYGLEYSFLLGPIISKEVSTTHFKFPIFLDFEKIYSPYYLIKKKRYVGKKYEKLDKKPNVDRKGIEAIRRDTLPLTTKWLNQIQHFLIEERSTLQASIYMGNQLQSLLNCGNSFENSEFSYSDFILSRQYNRTKSDNLPHVQVVLKMAKRNPGSEPKLGDRIEYVLIQSKNPKAKVFEKSEDPTFASEHNLQLDLVHYLEKNAIKPICNFMRYFDPDIDQKFNIYISKFDAKQSNNSTIIKYYPEFQKIDDQQNEKWKHIKQNNFNENKSKVAPMIANTSIHQYFNSNSDSTRVTTSAPPKKVVKKRKPTNQNIIDPNQNSLQLYFKKSKK